MTFGDYKWGDKGAGVEEMQRSLATLGYPVVPDGNFGNETYAAVQQFQRDSGLAVDGIVGPNTTAAIARALTGAATEPPMGIDLRTLVPEAYATPATVPAGSPAAAKPISPLLLAAVAGFGAWFFLIRGVKRGRVRFV